jgi:hypothetical protein
MVKTSRPLLGLAALALLLLPASGLARTAAVCPMVGKTGTDPLLLLNITSLVASEMEIAGKYEKVRQLEQPPKGMNLACLGTPSCLGGIARGVQVDSLVGGSISKVGEEMELSLVLFDLPSSSIVRKKVWKLPADSAALADQMTRMVAELLTGKAPATKAVPDKGAFKAEADMEFDEAGKPQAPAPDPESLDEFAGMPDEDEANDVPAVKAGPPPKAAPPEQKPKVKTKVAVEANATDDIQIQPVSPELMELPGEDDPDARSDLDVLEEEARSDDEGRPARKGKPSSNEKARKEKADLDADRKGKAGKGVTEKPRTTLAARLGASGYHDMLFVTYGGELAIPLGSAFRLQAGLEFFSAKQSVPVEAAGCVGGAEESTEDGLVRTCWRSLMPIHVGGRYQKSDRDTRPFVGGDLLFTPYHRDAGGNILLSDMAWELRLRGGLDHMVSDGFGLGLNAAVGFLSGSHLDEVGLEKSGLNWQVSAGTVFGF